MWPAAGDIGLALVDVRDVAALHCLAMVTPAAKGRCVGISALCMLLPRYATGQHDVW